MLLSFDRWLAGWMYLRDLLTKAVESSKPSGAFVAGGTVAKEQVLTFKLIEK